MLVKLSDIHASTRVRKTLDTEKLDELAESFGEIGQLCPVLLRPNGDGYQVVFGHRRVDAARQNGESAVEAIVRELDDTETLIAALAENVVREDMDDEDIGRTLKDIMEVTGKNQTEVGILFGLDNKRVNEYISALPYLENVPKSSKEDISRKHVIHAKAGTGGDDKLVNQVLQKAAKEKLTIDQTRRVAEEVKRAQDFDGAKGVKATLKKPYEEIGKTWLKKHDKPIVDKVEGEIAFEWLKQPEVLEVEHALKLASRVIALMAKKREDVGSAKHILRQWRNFLTNLLNQIDEVEKVL